LTVYWSCPRPIPLLIPEMVRASTQSSSTLFRTGENSSDLLSWRLLGACESSSRTASECECFMLGLELILRLCVCVLCNFWPLFFLNKRGAFFRKTTEHRNTDAVKKNGKQCRQNGTGGEITDRGQGERCAYHPPYYPNPPPPPHPLICAPISHQNLKNTTI
jgi:hypothetical protein